ncbi:MAG: pitrilysin family protein [bacterium]|nr:pitrilysin family protein [bacterium]
MTVIRELKNGVRVVMERMEHVRSVSVGIWVNTGSVREAEDEGGASHFIEHMAFKGTARRTAEQIAAEMDAVGGSLNAFTSKECTCFYAKVLDEHLPVAIDVLSDITFHSTFPEDELEREKHVILEEILMTEDSPEDLTAERANALFFQNEPLARPILGTRESVLAFDRDRLLAYRKEHYTPRNVVVACAGHFDEEALMRLVEEKLDLEASDRCASPLVQRYPGGARAECVQKDIEQVHLTLMLPGIARDAADQYPLAVLSNVIGGSMSSRLFQSIREQRGLAYSIYSYPIYYAATGTFALYAGTGENQAVEVVRLMREELEKLRNEGVTREEFERCKAQLKGSYVLGLEGSGSRMNTIGKVALLQNREYREEDTINSIECVTMEDIRRVIPIVLDESQLCASFVGRVAHQEDALLQALK